MPLFPSKHRVVGKRDCSLWSDQKDVVKMSRKRCSACSSICLAIGRICKRLYTFFPISLVAGDIETRSCYSSPVVPFNWSVGFRMILSIIEPSQS